MGFNKVYLPDYDILVKELKVLDSKTFADRYRKADALIGPSQSVNLVTEYLEEYYEGSRNFNEDFLERFQRKHKV